MVIYSDRTNKFLAVLRFLENSFSSEYNATLQQMYQRDVEVFVNLSVKTLPQIILYGVLIRLREH